VSHAPEPKTREAPARALVPRALLLLPMLAALSTSGAHAASSPVRVATLLPFVEDALALDPERIEVVATVRRALHSPIAAGTIDLGNPHSPSFEGLAASGARYVVGDRVLHGAMKDAIEGVGAELILIDTGSADATLASLEALAEKLGGSPRIAAAIGEARARLAALKRADAGKVLLLFGTPGSFFVVTDRAWLGQLAEAVGFTNVAPETGDERFPGMVPVNDEALAFLRPDLVLLVAHGDPRAIRAELERRTAEGGAWARLGRARHGIRVLDPSLFGANPGLRLPEAAEELLAFTEADARRPVSIGP